MLSILAIIVSLAVFSSIYCEGSRVDLLFDYTGEVQTFAPPLGVDSITVTLYGASGADTSTGKFKAGGNGAIISSTIPVEEGEVFQIFVGGAGFLRKGGFNGGGHGKALSYSYAGGGATDIRAFPYDLSERLVVAGGGGGASGNCPSAGGRADLTTRPATCISYPGGEGATISQGGAFGDSAGGTHCSDAVNSGTFGQGGDACGASSYGGAGGGGYFGGGGAYGSGGGGGSSWSAFPFTLVDGPGNDGNGYATVSYNTVSADRVGQAATHHARLPPSLSAHTTGGVPTVFSAVNLTSLERSGNGESTTVNSARAAVSSKTSLTDTATTAGSSSVTAIAPPTTDTPFSEPFMALSGDSSVAASDLSDLSFSSFSPLVGDETNLTSPNTFVPTAAVAAPLRVLATTTAPAPVPVSLSVLTLFDIETTTPAKLRGLVGLSLPAGAVVGVILIACVLFISMCLVLVLGSSATKNRNINEKCAAAVESVELDV